MIYPLPDSLPPEKRLLMRIAGYSPLTGAFERKKLCPIYRDDQERLALAKQLEDQVFAHIVMEDPAHIWYRSSRRGREWADAWLAEHRESLAEEE